MCRRQSEQITLFFFSIPTANEVWWWWWWLEGQGVIYVKWNHRVRLSVCLCAHFRARPSVGIYVGMMLHAHVTSNSCNVLWKYVSLLLTIWRRAPGIFILIGHSVSILKGFFFLYLDLFEFLETKISILKIH